ncbi:hypothetical protein [Speluncibacter jeojiensis]|uniref:hypothetical protein n=1 Tax=Speluncibacter jeojiensis TaxID=2710754 RepID=UPI0024108FD4|nr:hypothetical protein [Rhodococcus sp. D2-41]
MSDGPGIDGPATGGPVADEVALDLVPVELIARQIRRMAAVVVAIALVVAVVCGIFLPWAVAVIVGVVLAVPGLLTAAVALRRRIRLTDTVITARGLRTVRVDAARADVVELLVRPGRIAQVLLRVADGGRSVTVPLALYAEQGARELPLLAMRRLADALASGESPGAAALSAVLVEQLRAEAREAGAGERPLYRATRGAAESARRPVTLSAAQVAALLN